MCLFFLSFFLVRINHDYNIVSANKDKCVGLKIMKVRSVGEWGWGIVCHKMPTLKTPAEKKCVRTV